MKRSSSSKNISISNKENEPIKKTFTLSKQRSCTLRNGLNKNESYSAIHKLSKTLEKSDSRNYSSGLNYIMKGKTLHEADGEQVAECSKRFNEGLKEKNFNQMRNRAVFQEEDQGYPENLYQTSENFKEERMSVMSRRCDSIRSERNKELEESKKQIQTLKERVSCLEDELISVEKQKIDLQSSIKLIMKKHDLEMSRMKKQMEKDEISEKELQGQLDEQLEEISRLQNEKVTLQKELIETKKSQEKEKEDLRAYYQESQITPLKLQIEELKAELVMKDIKKVQINLVKEQQTASAQSEIVSKLNKQNRELLDQLQVSENRVKQLTKDFQSLQNEYSLSLQEIESLRSSLSSQKKEHQTRISESKFLQDQVGTLDSEVDRMKVQLKEYEEKVQEQRQQFEERQSEMVERSKKYDEQIKWKNQRIETMEKLVYEKESLVKQRESQLSQLQSDLSKDHAETKAMQQSLRHSQQLLQKQTVKYQQLEREYDQLKRSEQQQIQQNDASQKSALEQLFKEQQSNKILAQKAQTLSDEVSHLKRTIKTLEIKKESMEMVIKEGKEQISKLSASNAYLEKLNQSQTKQIESSRRLIAESERVKQNIIKEQQYYDRSRSELQKRVERLVDENSKCQETISKLNERHGRNQQQSMKVEGQTKVLQYENKTLKMETLTLTKEKTALSDEVTMLKREIKRKEEEIHQLNNSYKSCQTSYNETQIEISYLQKRVENKSVIEEEFAKNESKIKGLQMEVKELIAQLGVKCKAVIALQQEVEQKNMQIKRLKAEIDETENQLTSEKAKGSALLKQIQLAKETNEKLSKQCKEKLGLQLKVQALQCELKKEKQSQFMNSDWQEKYEKLHSKYSELSQKYTQQKRQMERSQSKKKEHKRIISNSYRYNQEILDHCQELLQNGATQRRSVERRSNFSSTYNCGGRSYQNSKFHSNLAVEKNVSRESVQRKTLNHEFYEKRLSNQSNEELIERLLREKEILLSGQLEQYQDKKSDKVLQPTEKVRYGSNRIEKDYLIREPRQVSSKNLTSVIEREKSGQLNKSEEQAFTNIELKQVQRQ